MRKLYRLLVITIIMTLCMLNLTGCDLLKKDVKTIIQANDPYAVRYSSLETLVFCFPGEKNPAAEEVIKKIEEQLKDTLNVKLQFKWYHPDVYLDKVKSLIDSNGAIDAFMLTKNEKHDEIKEMSQEGKLLDLTTLYKTESPSLYNIYSPEEIQNVTYDGKVAVIPEHFPKTSRICALVDNDVPAIMPSFCNKKMKDIQNDDDYLYNFNEFKYRTINSVEASAYVNVGDYLVYKWDDPEMKLIPWEQTPEFKQAVAHMREWKAKNYYKFWVNFGNAAGGLPEEIPDFEYLRGKQDGKIRTNWGEVQEYIHLYGDGSTKFKLYPLFPDKVAGMSTNVSGIALSKNTKKQERILKFLQWVQSSQENYDLFMYGIQGKNYTLKDNKLDFPSNDDKYLGWYGSSAFLNINYYRDKTTDPENFKDTYMKELDTGSKYQPSFGFAPENKTVADLVTKRNKLYDTMENRLNEFEEYVGDEDVDKFIQEQKDAGAEQLLSEIQKQLEEWGTKNKK